MPNRELYRCIGPQSENQKKKKKKAKRDKYLNLARKLKETIENKGDGDISCNRRTWNSP